MIYSRCEEVGESEGYGKCKFVIDPGVLAAACPYFNAMFMAPLKESKQNHVSSVHLTLFLTAFLVHKVILSVASSVLLFSTENISASLLTSP